MQYLNTTQVPNLIFDNLLPTLTLGELKVLLVIIRQTNGWINPRTGKRKERDRISHSQFMKKTGLSRRVISTSLAALVGKGIIVINDTKGTELATSRKRQGRSYIFYSLKLVQMATPTCAKKYPQPVQKSAYNKTNYTKLTQTKDRTVFSEHSEPVSLGLLLNDRMRTLTPKEGYVDRARQLL